jgi:hypothetical protein
MSQQPPNKALHHDCLQLRSFLTPFREPVNSTVVLHHFHEPARSICAVGAVMERYKIYPMRLKLPVDQVEVAAAGEAVIPGANHRINCFLLR